MEGLREDCIGCVRAKYAPDKCAGCATYLQIMNRGLRVAYAEQGRELEATRQLIKDLLGARMMSSNDYSTRREEEETERRLKEAGGLAIELEHLRKHINSLLATIEEQTDLRNAAERDALTMALRLLGEDESTFAPETHEVMKRWRPICEAKLRGEA